MAISKVTGNFIIGKPSDTVPLVSKTLYSDSLPTSDPSFLVSFQGQLSLCLLFKCRNPFIFYHWLFLFYFPYSFQIHLQLSLMASKAKCLDLASLRLSVLKSKCLELKFIPSSLRFFLLRVNNIVIIVVTQLKARVCLPSSFLQNRITFQVIYFEIRVSSLLPFPPHSTLGHGLISHLQY